MKLVFAVELRVPTHSRALTDEGAWHRLMSFYELRSRDSGFEHYINNGMTDSKIRDRTT